MKKPDIYFEINEVVSRLLDLQEKNNFNFKNVIKEVLTIHGLKIVRCADCKHCQQWDNYDQPQYTCSMWSEQYDMSTEPNGYCHYGEIRENVI